MSSERKTFNDMQSGAEDGARNIFDRTIGKWLAALGISPNAVTLSGTVICLLACILWLEQTRVGWFFWAGLGLFVFGCLGDVVDGSVARMAGKKTEFGKELDAITDRLVETGLIAAVAVVILHSWLAAACVVAIGGSITVSYARMRAERLDLKGNVGYGDRLVRLVVMGVVVIAARLFGFGFQWGIYVICGLSWYTVAQRTMSIRQQLIAKGTP